MLSGPVAITLSLALSRSPMQRAKRGWLHPPLDGRFCIRMHVMW